MNDVAAEHGSWLTPLPSRWRELRLKYIASCNDEVLQETTPEAKKIEYVDIGSVSSTGDIVSTETILFVDAPSRARRMVRQGDVLVSTVRTYLKAIAPVRNAPKNLIASTGFAVIRSGSGAVSDYLAYVLRAEGFIGEVISRSVGISYPAINASDLVNICIPAPPMGEQTQIARFLDYETAKIDALIEKQQQLIALLKEKRQAVISHAVTKGLNPDAPLRDSGVEWLGEVPAHWTVVRLKHICEIQSGMPKGKPASATTVDMPMLRVANVQDGWLNLDDVHQIPVERSQVARYLLQSRDVLMNEGGDRDKLGRGTIWRGEVPNCIHQNHVFAIRPLSIEPEWLDAVTRADYAKFHFYQVAKQSTNLASISSSNIKETPLVVPPVDERKAILAHIELMTAKTSTTIELADRQNVLLQERRTALISAAVTGKIDVRNWKSPDDE